LNKLITPENFGGQTARNYPHYDLAFSALANPKFLVGRIWTTFGSFVGSLFDKKLGKNPTKSGITIQPKGWLYRLCVLVYIISYGSLYFPY
jgi:hypothetical protein